MTLVSWLLLLLALSPRCEYDIDKIIIISFFFGVDTNEIRLKLNTDQWLLHYFMAANHKKLIYIYFACTHTYTYTKSIKMTHTSQSSHIVHMFLCIYDWLDSISCRRRRRRRHRVPYCVGWILFNCVISLSPALALNLFNTFIFVNLWICVL